MTTTVYTDGACIGNPGPGGWAWATDDRKRQGTGSCPQTTNNRMELSAVIEAVLACEGPLVVVSDSAYVINSITLGWVYDWRHRGWTKLNQRTGVRTPTPNSDLWIELVAAIAGRKLRWQWVKGHSGVPMNEFVDHLAGEAAARQSGKATAQAPVQKVTSVHGPSLFGAS